MELVTRAIGPLQTNVCLVGDPRTREAIVIDGAIPGLPWVVAELRRRDWRLLLIVSTHGHWDHTGENAALQAWSLEQAADAVVAEAAGGSDARPHGAGAAGTAGAEIAAHRADWHRLIDPQPLFAPFPIPPCVPAVELAEGGVVRVGDVRLEVLHTPGHTEGSVCLLSADDGILFSGDTLFAGGWGRVDLPGGDAAAMADSLARLAGLNDALRVVPGHGRETTIARERPLLELIAREHRLPG
ncbi:MAG TPA: MBL fold metallo-hydrolase [Candidatus Limnocylindrales bacterium]|jgi:hydroxyacylglutathione hydrolase